MKLGEYQILQVVSLLTLADAGTASEKTGAAGYTSW